MVDKRQWLNVCVCDTLRVIIGAIFYTHNMSVAIIYRVIHV